MCHSSVLASDPLKHSTVLTVLKHCELSDIDKSSPTLTAAMIQTAKFSFEVSNPLRHGGCSFLR